jgi:hypothetical protein
MYFIPIKVIFTTIFFLVILAFFSNAHTNNMLTGGFAKSNITPEKPVNLSGFAARDGLSTGVHDSLYVRVSTFEQGSKRLVIVSTDIISFYNDTDQIIRDRIMEKFKLASNELFLSTIHTHSGPRIILDESKGHPNNVAYTKRLQNIIIKTIYQAFQKMQPVQICAGSGSSPVGVNRREVFYDKSGNPRMWLGRVPGGITDQEVSIIKLSQNEKTLCVMFEYAVHGTSLGWDNYLVSGDVLGIAEQFVERYLGQNIITPAYAGASGDISPWYRVLPSFNTKNGWIPEPVLMGTMLGEEVIHVLNNLELEANDGSINSIFTTLELPGKPDNQFETPKNYPKTSLNISVARIGDIAFVGIGAEVLCEIGMDIKAASPFKHTLILTHCNGDVGYLVPQHRFYELGYEVKTAPFASSAGEQVVKQIIRMLHQL